MNTRETFMSPMRRAKEATLGEFSAAKTRYLSQFEGLNPEVPGPFVDNRE